MLRGFHLAGESLMAGARKKKAGSERVGEARGGKRAGTDTNLEMDGDRLKVFSLQTLLTNKKSPETRDLARLGDVLLPWYEKAVEKPAEKMEGISEQWETLVPERIRIRSRLIGFQRGVLTVALDSAAMRAEMDATLRGGLLRELQAGTKGAIFRVKTCIQN